MGLERENPAGDAGTQSQKNYPRNWISLEKLYLNLSLIEKL